MKSLSIAIGVAFCPLIVLAQNPANQAPAHQNAPASQEVQTETIGNPGPASTAAAASKPAGVLELDQVKALMHRVWLAEFRLSDLVAQVHPDKWKMAEDTRQSFQQSVQALQQAIRTEEDWRGQYEARPDSLYLGFQTYLAIGALLPRVDGVAHGVAQYENASFGGQYSQAANQLFDLRQLLEPHLIYLLKNQDDVLVTAQSNLASCQHELNFAEHDREGKATPMKNIAPDFKGRLHKKPAEDAAPATPSAPAKKPASEQQKNPPKK